MILYKILLSSLVAFQILGPSWFLVLQTSEAFAQENSHGQVLIAGLRGVVTVTPGMVDRPGYTPNYRSSLGNGDVITTEEESVAELLFENQGLLTVQEYSEAKLGTKPDGGLSVNLRIGAAELSLPLKGSSQGSLTLSTPNIRATTNGGLITAEVQPTLSDTAEQLGPRNSFLVRTSLRAQSTPPGNVALLETFCVKEGDLRVEYPGTQSGVLEQKEVPAGQCAGFFNGALRAMGDEYQIADWRAICAVGPHCDIPESAKKLIAQKQMKQALALEEAMLGSDADEGEIDEDTILATTGLLLAAAIQGANGPGGIPPDPGILPCTGDPQLCGGGGDSLPPPQFPNLNVGGMAPLPTAFFNTIGVNGGSPPIPGPSNIQTGESLWPVNGMPGGQGLLSFIKGDFTADKELLLADSGFLASAPHRGKAPQNSLVVSDLSPNGAGSPSNQKLPLKFSLFNLNLRASASGTPVDLPAVNQTPTSNAQLGTEGTSRLSQAELLAQFARSSLIDPANPLASLPEADAENPCLISMNSCFEIVLAAGLGGLEQPDPKVDSDAGIDGTIQVRSASTNDPTPGDNRLVTLKKGVVLGNTQVSLALQEKTNSSFSGLETTLGQAIQGSAVSVLGVPGDPALVNVEDRVLAILGGSRIQSADPSLMTALLAVKDGTLRGPTKPSLIGKDAAGVDVLREDVSPIIEVIGSSAEVTTGVMVGSTATAGQTGILDQALLEATSPLLAMIKSNLTTASDFGRVAGQNAKIDATLLPGDALVRLNASSLMVNGNLFNVTGEGQLIVNGNLTSLQGGSTLTLSGGAFVNVGAGSLFSLTNGALVDFGTGNNVVNVTNSLCAGGGCFAPFANPTFQVAGSSSDFSAPPGFNPFTDAGTFPDGSVNQVNVAPGSAILAVAPGGTIQIQ